MLNRLTSISYVDSAQNVTFAYDQANGNTGCATSFPTGRLTRMTDASGNTTYCYDRRGNITSKAQVTGDVTAVVSYAYAWAIVSAAGLSERHGIGSPTTRPAVPPVSRSAPTATDIVDNVTDLPFGPASQIAFDGGATIDFAYLQKLLDRDVGGSALDLDLSTNASAISSGSMHRRHQRTRLWLRPAVALDGVEDGNAALVKALPTTTPAMR